MLPTTFVIPSEPKKSNYLIAIPVAVFLLGVVITFSGRRSEESSRIPSPSATSGPAKIDVAEFEARLETDKAYARIWALPRADLNVFLSALSNRLILSSLPAPITSRVRELALADAVDTLAAIHARTGSLPAAFVDELKAHLGKTRHGLWGKSHDYTALACIVDPDNPAYLRERILAVRATGFRYARPEVPKQYWLVNEKDAREHLCTLVPTDPDCVAKEAAPNVFHTKTGYFAAVSKALLERGIAIAASGDDQALARYLVSPGVIRLDSGTEVVVIESGGILSGTVKFRKRGEIMEYWTVREALER